MAGKGERTRQAILDAAIDRFGRDGFRSSSVADISRDAGGTGSLAYAYFPNKEALFLAALDEDAARVIHEGVSHILTETRGPDWQASLVVTLIDALGRHPLARRVLAGREPDVTDRVVNIPAMLELRKAIAERLREDQLVGTVRSDIDPVAVGDGLVTITMSLLMAVLQFGTDMLGDLGPGLWSVVTAALDPPATT